jgi:hypothetical protein
MTQKPVSRTYKSCLAAYLALGMGVSSLVGCSDDESVKDDGAGATSSSSGGAGAAEGGTPGAAGDSSGSNSAEDSYLVVVTERESPAVDLQYLHVLEAWPESGELDYDTAVELGEFVSVYAMGPAVFVHQPDDGSVRKLVVKPDGTVTEDVTVSFAKYGVTGFSGDMVYVSPTRAYLVDEAAAQIVIWDPSAMEVLGAATLAKEALSRGDLAAQLSRGIALDGEGFVAASYRNWDTLEYHDAAAIGVFDATADEPELQIIEDDRCSSTVTTPFDGGDGFVYLISDAALGFDALANPKRTENSLCVLRMSPGTGKFDESFFVDLKEVLGSPGFYAAHPMKDGKLLVNLWAPDVELDSVANPEDSNWYWEYPPYFEYAIVDLASGKATPVPDLGRAAVQWSITLRVDNNTYVQTYREDTGSDVYRVDIDGSATRVLSNVVGADVQYLGRIDR